jgi:hypothetical protein
MPEDEIGLHKMYRDTPTESAKIFVKSGGSEVLTT